MTDSIEQTNAVSGSGVPDPTGTWSGAAGTSITISTVTAMSESGFELTGEWSGVGNFSGFSFGPTLALAAFGWASGGSGSCASFTGTFDPSGGTMSGIIVKQVASNNPLPQPTTENASLTRKT